MKTLFVICFFLVLTRGIANETVVKDPEKSTSIFGVDCSLIADDDTFEDFNHYIVLERLKEMGIQWVRETLMQSGLEYPKGTYHWERSDSIIRRWQNHGFYNLVLIHGGSNYTGPITQGAAMNRLVPTYNGMGNAKSTLEEWLLFVQKAVERYDGDGFQDMPGLKYPIKHWESWNEPNQVNVPGEDGYWYRKWPDALQSEDILYLNILHKGFYKAVKKADSSAVVVGPSVLRRGSYDTDHRQEFYCQTGMDSYFDLVNYHWNRLYIWYNGWDESTDCIPHKRIWFTESGRHKLPGETDYENYREYIKLLIQGAWLTKTRIFRIFHYFEEGEDNLYFDVYSPGYPLKPMGIYIKTIVQLLDHVQPVYKFEYDNWRLFKFRGNNHFITAIWSTKRRHIEIPVSDRMVKRISMGGEEKNIIVDGKNLEITIGREPIFILENITQSSHIPVAHQNNPISGIQNYPNPFNSCTLIRYTLEKNAKVTLTLYNTRGQVVEILRDDYQTAGSHTITWDAKDMASGVYYYCLSVDGIDKFKKMLLLK